MKIAEKAKAAAAGNGNGCMRHERFIETVTDAEDLVGEDAKLGKAGGACFDSRQVGDTTHTTRSDVSTDVEIPTAPFYGSKVVEDIDLDEVFAFINETALFKGQWQYKQGESTKEEYEQASRENSLSEICRDQGKSETRKSARRRKSFTVIFPCQSEGNDLIIYEDDETTEKLRFTFPRQPLEQRGGKNLCLADYFASKDSGKIDVVAFRSGHDGTPRERICAELFKSDNYTDYLLFHGLSVESAEALAEMWHKRIREELGIAGSDAPELAKLFHQGYQGSRYSFGYPACPNLEDQTKLFELLQPGTHRCRTHAKNSSFDPEQSTSAIIVHHPEAKYFNIE